MEYETQRAQENRKTNLITTQKVTIKGLTNPVRLKNTDVNVRLT